MPFRRVRPSWAAGAALALACLAVAAFAAQGQLRPAATAAGRAGPAELAAADAQGVLDSDHDGLSDARETYLVGTSATQWDTAGTGVPDGWLVAHGYDPLDPLVGGQPAAKPPAEL